MIRLITPRTLAAKAEMYFRLGQLTAAGLTLSQALQELTRNPPTRSFRNALLRLWDHVNRGSTFSEAAKQASNVFTDLDIALLKVGEETGTLDKIFYILSQYYHERVVLVRSVLRDMIYPAVVFHMAIAIFGFLQHIPNWDMDGFLVWLVSVLGPLYVIVFLIIYVAQQRLPLWAQDVFERVCRFLPLIGPVKRNLALAKLAVSLEALVKAGYPIIRAWEIAAETSGSPALQRAISTWRRKIELGETPASLVRSCTEFPELFANLYETGEISGKLDDSLQKIAEIYQEKATHGVRLLARTIPWAVYLLGMILAAYVVISFWVNYYKGLLGD